MYEEMIEYVRMYLEQDDIDTTDLLVRYAFRSRFDHILRVYAWAMRIIEVEPGDREVVAVSAIFHDIGKVVKREIPHAEAGALICGEYLDNIGFPEEKKQKIVNTIRFHSSKLMDQSLLTYEQKILIDADLLDEVGATAVLWDSMAVALGDKPGYLKAYQRHCEFYHKLKKYRELLKTDYGRLLYDGRLSVLYNFIKELEYELGITPHHT